QAHGVPARDIGFVHDGVQLEMIVDDREICIGLAQLDDAYFETIPRLMSRAASAVSDSPVTTAV
ncbi:MAG: hypothetical protein B7Z72_11795, partial [Gemmatimonadetes bacterium 21-71-4]